MTDTTEQMGIALTLQGAKEVLKDFADIRREARSLGRDFAKSMDDIAKARQKMMAGMNVPSLLQNAAVYAHPPSSVNTSTSGNRMNIHVFLHGLATSASAGSRALVSGGRTAAPWLPSGPRQQRAKLWEAMHYAASVGNFNAFDDAKEQYDRLNKRLTPKTTGDRLMDLIYTSRFGVGGGKLSPLIGKAMDVAGGRNSPTGKALLGVGILGNAAIELGKTFFSLVQAGSDAVNSMNRLAAATGGNMTENALLRGMASAAGLGPEDMSATTKALQQAMQSGMGQVYAAKAGIYNLPGAFGSQDWAKNEIKILNYLRELWKRDKTPEHDETLREARSLGQEAWIPSFAVSDAQWNKNIKTAMNMSKPNLIQGAADFEAAKNRVSLSFENLAMKISGKGGVIAALNKFADFLDNLSAPNSQTHKNAMKAVDAANLMFNPLAVKARAKAGVDILRGTSHLWDFNRSVLKKLGISDPAPLFAKASPHAQEAYQRSLQRHQEQQRATQNHIDALRKNTDATAGLHEIIAAVARGGGMPGSYGNMTRQGVMPRQIDTGFVLNRYLASKALQLSSF